MSGNVRFVKNMLLKVEVDGKEETLSFSFGDIYPVDYVKYNADAHCDIVFKDGSVAKGVRKDLFENLKATIVEVKEDILPSDFEEIKVKPKAAMKPYIASAVAAPKPVKNP